MSTSVFCICGLFALILLLILIATREGAWDFECEYCGEKYKVEETEMYIAMEDDGLDITLYDSCDCPNCGCQNIICQRLEKAE